MAKKKPEAPKLKYKYLCSACTNVAIRTSNHMLGVSVDCASCGTLIKLDDRKRYKKIES